MKITTRDVLDLARSGFKANEIKEIMKTAKDEPDDTNDYKKIADDTKKELDTTKAELEKVKKDLADAQNINASQNTNNDDNKSDEDLKNIFKGLL